MWSRYAFLMSLLVHQAINGHGTEYKRHKRYLLFTTGTQWGVFVTVSMPLHPETTVSVAWFIEANYYSVSNASYFEPLLGDIPTIRRSEEGRNIEVQSKIFTRRRLYTFIESMLKNHGYPGHSCLLRAICENATSHFLHNGLLGDLLHLALTPSTSMSEDDLEDDYYEAEYLGLDNECEHYVEECPSNPIDMISISMDKFL